MVTILWGFSGRKVNFWKFCVGDCKGELLILKFPRFHPLNTNYLNIILGWLVFSEWKRENFDCWFHLRSHPRKIFKNDFSTWNSYGIVTILSTQGKTWPKSKGQFLVAFKGTRISSNSRLEETKNVFYGNLSLNWNWPWEFLI